MNLKVLLLFILTGPVLIAQSVRKYSNEFMNIGVDAAARSLNVQSELGLQLDSLADMVTSGLVPGIAMFQLMERAIGAEYEVSQEWSSGSVLDFNFPLFALFGLIITLGSAYRLAKFNIDERQTSSFIGLPTPANAIFILSLPLILIYQPEAWVVDIILNKWFLLIVTFLSCFMLNAEVPLFALKFKNWSNANRPQKCCWF